MKKRTAFTLVELIIVMSAGSVLLFLAIGLVHQSMQLSKIGRDRADNDRASTRFAAQFREDVHIAESATLESKNELKLKLTEKDTVTYTVAESQMLRKETQADGSIRTEKFSLSKDSSFKLEEAEQPSRILCRIERDPRLHGDSPRLDRFISAIVGRRAMKQHAVIGPKKQGAELDE